MAFAEDLPTMFDTDVFAVQATIALPADIAGGVLVGIFDEAYLELDVGGSTQSGAPAFTLPTADIPSAMADALNAGEAVSLEIDGVTFQVVEPQPDGTGITVLRLRK